MTTTYTEKKTLPYTAEQMFDLVADVSRYPEFLPWCRGARVLSEDGEQMEAELIIGYKVIREKFKSKVFLHRPDMIGVEYLSGPLRNLSNRWRFIPDEQGGCIVDFYVEFEFKNPLLKSLVKLFFDEIVRRMVQAFEARAIELYGSTVSPSKSA